MDRAQLGAQLFTVRQFTQTAADLRATLARIREIGYTAVQLSAIGPIPPQTVRELTAEHDLTICNTHIPWKRLQKELPAVIAEHRLWGCEHVALGSMPQAYRGEGEAGFRRFARAAEAVGRQLYKAGLSFSYHNHSFEFARFGRRTGLDIIYDETDPRYLQAEIDTYWVQHGGGDPAAWIEKVSNRMPAVHLKDMVIVDGRPTMAEVGEGNLNWPVILQACRGAGVSWYLVEQDICRRDPFESLAISYANLVEWGLG